MCRYKQGITHKYRHEKVARLEMSSYAFRRQSDSGSKSDKSKSAHEGSVGRVQSYDYSNKYTRDYPHPTEELVHGPSARERTDLVMQKEEERERMRARSEERGRKALERKQVRRDCMEKLDALTQQYPKLLNPTDHFDTSASTMEQAPEQHPAQKSPTRDVPLNSSVGHDAPRHGRGSRRGPRSSSDCEFLSDFGLLLNLRDFLTKELLKHASSSRSTTPTDDSLRSAFLQFIVDTMTPRTNAGSNQLDRQKTSTPITHSASSDPHSSGIRSGSSSGNTPSLLFFGESCRSNQ